MIASLEPLPPYRSSTTGYSTGTVTITLTGGCHFYASNNIYIQPEPNHLEVARKQARSASLAAITRARLALQRALDDPHPGVPLGARKRPYRRPAVKGRVCAGSSRYRVMVG
jgi:hypothetical protein